MLRNRKLATFALVFVAVTLLLVILTVKSSFAANEANVNTNEIAVIVRPLVIMNISAVPGENFTVNVNVTVLGTMDLHGFTLRLGYDPALVKCTSVYGGDMFQTNVAEYNFSIDNSGGNVYASSNFTLDSTIDKNGTLVTLMFQVNGTGETSLHLYDTFLYDASGSLLQYEVIDGYFNNKFNFDVTMPLALVAVTFASMLLNPKIENRLKGVLEDREFRVRDAVMLVGLMAVMITVVVLVRQLSAILMVLFLFSYSLLLFTFSYLISKNRWYLGVVAPAVFILMYVFLRDSFVWTFYLSNIYGLVFAIMITLYLSGLFGWTTTAVFGGLLTGMDIVLVLVTKTMVQAATAVASLSLPVLVSLPLFPLITTGTGVLMLSLGLGDFFFAGLLAIQTFKKFGRRLASASVIGMTVSFFIFEAFILSYRIGAFPGTLMIICGWIPFVLFQTVRNWRNTRGASSEKMLPS